MPPPTLANPAAISGNQSRKVETERIANRTSFALDVGKLDIDTWAIHKSLYHPIFQVIDQDGWTYGIAPHWAGSFDIAGYRNDTILGLRAFADHANTLKVPGYAVFNVAAGFDFRNGVSLFVDARNLTDTRYVSDISVVTNAASVAGGPVAFYPGAGRSVFGGIRAGF